MSNARLLLFGLIFLGIALLMCLGGIIYLSAAIPARPIPDVLIGTVSLIAGGILGMFVPRPGVGG